jgi:PAS domain S-box-containing protein
MLGSPPFREEPVPDASPAPLRGARVERAAGPFPDGRICDRSLDDLGFLIEVAPMAVVTVDAIDRVIGWNEEAEGLFGWRASEILGHRNPLSLPGPDPEIDPWRLCLASGESLLERRISRRRRDGMMIDLRVSAIPLAGRDGEVVGAIAMMTSSASDRTGEEAVDRHRLLTGLLGDPLLVADGNGTIVDANAAAAATYGWERSELVGLPLSQLCARDRSFVCPVEKILATGGSVTAEGMHARKDGSIFPVEATLSAGDIAGERVVVAVIRNVTTRKRHEAARGLLHEIDRWLLGDVSLDTILESTCRRLASIHDLAIVSIALLPADGEVEIRARGGPKAACLDDLEIRLDEGALGQGPIGKAIRTGLPQETDVENDPDFEPWREQARKRGLGRSVAIPLVAQGKTLGAFCFWFRRSEPFPPEVAEALVGFAAEVAVSIVDARNRPNVRQQRVPLDSSADGAPVEGFGQGKPEAPDEE